MSLAQSEMNFSYLYNASPIVAQEQRVWKINLNNIN